MTVDAIVVENVIEDSGKGYLLVEAENDIMIFYYGTDTKTAIEFKTIAEDDTVKIKYSGIAQYSMPKKAYALEITSR